MRNFLLLSILLITLNVDISICQQKMEVLDRGLIAMSRGAGQIYVGWRMLGSDPPDVSFNLYRSVNGGDYIKVNPRPMCISTDTIIAGCDLSAVNSFSIRAVIRGVEQPPEKVFSVPANAPVRNYLGAIPLTTISGGTFFCNDGMAGDADGDGEYEVYIFRRNGGSDTSRMFLECYRLNGIFLWRFEFGPNINCSGEHNAGAYYVVGDFDGNGKAEVCVRASELSVFQSLSAEKRIIGDYLKPDAVTLYPFDPRGSLQRTTMPEYLYILEGLTGKPLDSIKYQPSITSDPFSFWGANERPFYQWMSMAYLDGSLPSIVTERGIGEGHPLKIYAWDFRDGNLTMRPDSFVTANVYNDVTKYYDATPAMAFGGHSIRIKDIDNDGRDEILLTAAAIDDDMSLIYNQADKGFGHGDMFEVLDIDPDRPGLEFFNLQQSNTLQIGSAMWDAATGDIIKQFFTTRMTDPGRAGAAPLIPYIKGAQIYGGTPGVMDSKGRYINSQNFTPCASAYWDADLCKELVFNDYNRLTGNIQKYDPSTGNVNVIFDFKAEGCTSPTMNGATMIGDLIGDWREEILYETSDHKELRIFTTTIPSRHRIYTLMQNPGYRVQTTCLGRIGGFFTDYYLGPFMRPVPPSPVRGEDIRWSGSHPEWDVNTTPSWHTGNVPSLFQHGQAVVFDDYGITGTITNTTANITGILEPASVTISSSIDYTFTGTGSLAGTMELLKTGRGILEVNNTNTFTGTTTVWDGELLINNNWSGPVIIYGGTYGGVSSGGLAGGRLGGNGTISSDIIVEENGAIVPGRGMSNAGTLVINGDVSFSRSSYCGFDISSLPSGIHDKLSISGNLEVGDTMSFFFNQLDGIPAEGDYPLVQYTGTLTGTTGLIRISGLDHIPCTLYLSGKTIGLRILPARLPASVVWAGTSNVWDMGITQSWTNNSFPDVFAQGDQVSFTDAGIAQSSVSLKSSLPVSGITISTSADYILKGMGAISGAGGLTKTGSGKLTILSDNTFTGPVSLNGGITEVTSINLKNMPGAFGSSALPVNIDGGTLRVAAQTVNTDRDFTIGSGGALFDIADTKYPLSLNGIISGSGAISKTGAGTLLLSGVNTFTGGLTINEGDVSLLGAAGNSFGTGPGTITLNGGWLNMANVQKSETAPWNLVLPVGKTAGLFTDGRCSITGKLTGGGTLNIMIPYVRTNFSGDWSAFTGTINIMYDPHFTPDFRINNNYGYSKAAFWLSQAAAMYKYGSGTTTVGEISGVAGSELATKDEAARISSWIVGTRNTDAIFAGTITGPGNITKSGTGTWTLSGKIRHTGITWVNGGTLLVTADSIKGSAVVNVNTGGTLGGTPFITGPVNVNSGGTIAPGNSATQTGTMKLLSTLDLRAGSTTLIKINKATGQQDSLRIKQSVFLGGALKIVLLGGSWSAGNTFRLIKASTYSGNFSEIIPSAPAPGFAWDMSLMETSGTIRIMGTQTILFGPLPGKLSHDDPFTISATGGASGNPVTFTSSDPKVAMISGNTVTITGPGVAFITASQEGNSLYMPADNVTQLLNVIEDGINDISMSTRIFPNPVTDILYLETSTTEGSWELYGSAGIKIRTGDLSGTKEIDFSTLAAGLYSLRIIRSGESTAYRIVKL